MEVTLSTIRFLYDYDRWANDRLLTVCEQLSAEQWGRGMGHSWGSVHGMLTHIFAAQFIWLTRWKGESPKALLESAEYPTFADLKNAWLALEGDLTNFIDAQTDSTINQPITYTNTRGHTHTVPLGQLMLHVANHGTHHRGELAAMLSLLEVPHPEDDVIGYILEHQKSKSNGNTH
jgi:uncharacterized damage-inducible protein DinB